MILKFKWDIKVSVIYTKLWYDSELQIRCNHLYNTLGQAEIDIIPSYGMIPKLKRNVNIIIRYHDKLSHVLKHLGDLSIKIIYNDKLWFDSENQKRFKRQYWT